MLHRRRLSARGRDGDLAQLERRGGQLHVHAHIASGPRDDALGLVVAKAGEDEHDGVRRRHGERIEPLLVGHGAVHRLLDLHQDQLHGVAVGVAHVAGDLDSLCPHRREAQAEAERRG